MALLRHTIHFSLKIWCYASWGTAWLGMLQSKLKHITCFNIKRALPFDHRVYFLGCDSKKKQRFLAFIKRERNVLGADDVCTFGNPIPATKPSDFNQILHRWSHKQSSKRVTLCKCVCTCMLTDINFARTFYIFFCSGSAHFKVSP